MTHLTFGISEHQTLELSHDYFPDNGQTDEWGCVRMTLKAAYFESATVSLHFSSVEEIDRLTKELEALRTAWLCERAAEGIRYEEQKPIEVK